MKVLIYSEDTPDGLEADWPAIPREGDVVTFLHRGGPSNLAVNEVRWNVSTNGEPVVVEIHLTYGPVRER